MIVFFPMFIVYMHYLQEEDLAAAQVYEEFVAAFDESGKNLNKAWVKGGTVNPADSKGEYYFTNTEFLQILLLG